MRNVFFSFKYDDVWRVNVVRNSWDIASAADRRAFGFLDKAGREQLKQQGDAAIAEWIRSQMFMTSVTVVLMGARTCESRWVRFEIEESIREGKGLLGIRLHEIKDPNRQPRGVIAALFHSEPEPPDMFRRFRVTKSDNAWWPRVPKAVEWCPRGPVNFWDNALSDMCKTYDWGDDGRANIARWIEDAAKKVGR